MKRRDVGKWLVILGLFLHASPLWGGYLYAQYINMQIGWDPALIGQYSPSPEEDWAVLMLLFLVPPLGAAMLLIGMFRMDYSPRWTRILLYLLCVVWLFALPFGLLFSIIALLCIYFCRNTNENGTHETIPLS